MHHVIIGNGIAGITAARTLRKHSNDDITVISGETDYFFSRTALMYVYMGHMQFEHTQPYEKSFWKKNRISLKKAWVISINTTEKKLLLDDNSTMHYDKLLIATGAVPNKYGWPGQDLKGVQGLYSYQDLMELEENTRNGINRAVIVGGGLIGIEMAEMLHSRNYPVTILVRESNYWSNVLPEQESKMITAHIRSHGFDLRLNSQLKEINDDGSGHVQSITTTEGEIIPCQVVGLTAGVSPNIKWLHGSDIPLNRGVLIDHTMRTGVSDIFAAGDCAEFHHPLHDRKTVEQVWYTGKLQGETAAMNMLGDEKLYSPGHWYNSAKFLDIEYQTYGTVLSKLRSGESEFYWQHRDGLKSMHLVFSSDDHRFIGINIFGIRMRHILFNQWLKEHRSVEYVLSHLSAANFDPEFYSRFEDEILDQWNNAFPGNTVKAQSPKQMQSVIFK